LYIFVCTIVFSVYSVLPSTSTSMRSTLHQIQQIFILIVEVWPVTLVSNSTICNYNSSVSTPRFNEVYVPHQVTYMCIRGTDFASVSPISRLDFGTFVSVAFCFFSFYYTWHLCYLYWRHVISHPHWLI